MKLFSTYSRWIVVLLVGMLVVLPQTTAFANDNANLGRLSGIVWQDSNNNGIHELEEQTLSGYPVYLQRTGSEVVGAMVAVVYTEADGGFVFENLEEGSYRVFTEAGKYHLIDVLGISASTVIDLPVNQMHSIFLPLTIR